MLPEFGTQEYTDYLKDLAEGYRHKFYQKTVTHAEEMSVHTEGKLPKRILDKKRPNEDSEIKRYRLESWEPVTKSLSEKVISTINRIFNPRLYNIVFKDNPGNIKEKESLEYYLTKGMPLYKSLMNFITQVYIKKDFTDPNAVILVEPYDYDISQTDYYKPIPKIYESENVIDFKESEYFSFLKGDMLTIVDKFYLRYFRKVEKNKKTKFEFESEYEHRFGIVPAFRCGGIVLKADNEVLYQSYISGVLPHWNKAISMTSDLDGSIINNLYPEKWEFTVDCDNEHCHDGKVTINQDSGLPSAPHSENTTVVQCSRCKGSGKISSKGPFNIYQVNKDAINPDAPLPTPPFGYGDKETGSIELLEQMRDKELDKGLFAINMDIVKRVGENQSGIAKTIDRQDLDSFLQQISSQAFGRVIPTIILLIVAWRYSNVINDLESIIPDIEEPAAFDVLSVNNLLEELKALKESDINTSVIVGLQKDIIDKRFTSEKHKKKLKTILMLDPLVGKSTDDILSAMSERVVSKEEYYLHSHISGVVEHLIDIDEGFLDLPYSDKKKLAYDYAVKKLQEMQPETINVEGVPDVTGEERPDIEAEAKARLKGSVGGTQGILQIQKSVAEGITQYSAAVALLIEIYGFDESQAKSILGKPVTNVA